MGEASKRKRKSLDDIRRDIELQSDLDIVQIPLQIKDGHFRGVPENLLPDVLKVWAKYSGDRTAWIYRPDKFWIKAYFKNPAGNLIERGDMIVLVKPNIAAKNAFLAMAKMHLDKYAGSLKLVQNHDHGCVSLLWMKRFVIAESVRLENKKKPANYWEFFPIVEVRTPDGEVEVSSVDVKDYLGFDNTFYVDRSETQPASDGEQKIFNEIITWEKLS